MAFWPKEHEDMLRELWAEGLTGTELAEELNEKCGFLPRAGVRKGPRPITRDMAIAKARRMGLPSRGSPIKPRA